MRVAGRELSTCCATLALVLALTLAVLIVVVVQPEPPVPPDIGNLPVVTDWSWDSVSGGGWSYLKRSGSVPAAITQDTRGPVSPTSVLAIDFTEVAQDSDPGVSYHQLLGLKEVYVEWWMKVSNNWTCSPAGCSKIHFIYLSSGDQYSGLYCLTPDGTCPDNNAGKSMKVGGQVQWADSGHPLGVPLFPNKVTTEIVRDRWYHLSSYLRWNSATGTCDGIWSWAVDGIVNGLYSDICFPAGASAVEVQIAPTRQIAPPPGEILWVDHIIVRGR